MLDKCAFSADPALCFISASNGLDYFLFQS